MKKTKTGRPRKPYVTSWGESINGLRRRENDGRWVIVSTGEMFSEANERQAVSHFHRRTSGDRTMTIQTPHLDGVAYGTDDVNRASARPQDTELLIEQIVSPQVLWPWLRSQLIERPKWVAEQVGIEQLAYLHDLKQPTKSPTLEAVGNLYFAHSKISGRWLVRSKTMWAEFCHAVLPAITLRDLTQEMVVEYQDYVEKICKSQTAIKHRFGQIKTIIAFSKKRGLWAEDRTRALAFCSVLIPPSGSAGDPDPIEAEDFQKLLADANEQMRAMLLVAMNCCMHAQEVADLEWSCLDLGDGTLVDRRNKTGVPRIAALWTETVAALQKIKRIDGIDAVFVTDATRQQHNANTIQKAFRLLRGAVSLPHVVFDQIRDGAYTAALEGDGVEFLHAQMLAGHRSGMADKYVLRRPKIVSRACLAIYKHYFGKAQPSSVP